MKENLNFDFNGILEEFKNEKNCYKYMIILYSHFFVGNLAKTMLYFIDL